MPGIFLSYRREDSAGWTGRLAERLKVKFGTASIFMDIDTIQPGTDFAEALRSAVSSCDVLLAMIGPNWPIATNPEGQRRLEDPNDWVRTELTTALNRSIPVIPVLVGGAALPKVDTLPDDLKKLFQYQTHELTDKRWEFDSSQLELVLEKVLGGGKPKRNVKQTLLANRGALVALAIVGIGLVVASISPVTRWSSQGAGNAQTNDGGIVPEESVASLPSPEPVAEPIRTEPAISVQSATTVEPPPAQPAPITTEPETAKVIASARTEDPKGRSLPAGIEVKFNVGDVTLLLTSIRLEDHSNDNWLLSTSVLIKNSGPDLFRIYGNDAFRFVIGNNRHAPTKATYIFDVGSDTEASGELVFAVPKAVRRIGLRITYVNEQTTIPIDLRSGVSRSDVQPSGIPRALARIARMDNIDNLVNYDFPALSLEPYNVESNLLRIAVRITTGDHAFHFYGMDGFRLVLDNLSYQPVRGSAKHPSAHTYADAEVVFIVPKSATQTLLRVKDRDTWRNVPINLKANHS